MVDDEIFKKNIERWGLVCPTAAKIVEKTVCETVSFTANENGEPNLKKEFDGKSFFLYSTDSINQQMQQWFENLQPDKFDFLFVYGLGLGYGYCVLREWLRNYPKAHLIFLEDDPEIIHRFMETQLATEFLNHPKVRLFSIPSNLLESDDLFELCGIISVLEKYSFSGLEAYKVNKPQQYTEFGARLDYFSQNTNNVVGEYTQYSFGFLNNFYDNILDLPRSHEGSKLFNQFKNVPAIICGAGPSLEKNIQVLKSLADKALILAGGTAVNALNAAGINPHFGLGVDPNPFQFTRLIANRAYETPFFYRTRINLEALKIVHGDHLYVPGTGGHLISTWFEKELGIKSDNIEEGHNVVNMSVSIAKALGCNPIILVGVDLAYSNQKTYAPDIQHHAIHDRRSNFFTKNPQEELILKNDIYGNKVTTLWKWIMESLWFGRFAQTNPLIKIINSTEGGLGFPLIQNIPLAEVAEEYLKTQYDFATHIHQTIQNSLLPKTVTDDKIVELLNKLEKSLNRCAELYEKIVVAWKEHLVLLMAGDKFEEHYVPPAVKELSQELEKEDGYEALLKIYNLSYIPIISRKYREINLNPMFMAPEAIKLKEIDFQIFTHQFLKTTASMNKYMIESVLKKYHDDKKLVPIQSLSSDTKKLIEKLSKEREAKALKQTYSYEDGILTLKDPDFDLNFKETCRLEKNIVHDSEGKIQFEQYFLNGVAHGPSKSFGPNNQSLSICWFLYGKRQGKSWFYYPDGKISSVLGYKEGKPAGQQEYYYPNGNLKTLLHFLDGKLNGEVLLYHLNGKMFRQLNFKEGKRHGVERLWNAMGIQLLEANYDNDYPSGIAREWFLNGNVSKEITFDDNTGMKTIRTWDQNGAPKVEDESKQSDYFDTLTRQTTMLTRSLEKINQDMAKIIPGVKGANVKGPDKSSSIADDFQQMQQEMVNLHKLNNKMIYESGLDPKNPKESIWKTPSSQRGMEKYLQQMTQKMSQDLSSMQDALSLALGLLAKNPDFQKLPDESQSKTEKPKE